MFKRKYNVGSYYDKWTKHYMNTGYGNVMQAHRTADVNELLTYIIKNSGIKNGLKILDAGCGICGPSVYIAKKFNVQITALTISKKQATIAKDYISQQNLQHKIEVITGDYHNLSNYFKDETFNLVIMLESYGHCHSPKKVLKGINSVLKKEGHVYIKDYFKKEFTGSHERRSSMKKIVKNMNKVYSYNLPDINKTLKILRRLDFELINIQRNKLPLYNDDSVKEFETNHDIDIFMGGFHYQILEPIEFYFKKPTDIDAEIK